MVDITNTRVQKLYLNGCDEQNTFRIIDNVVEIYASASSAYDYEPILASSKITVKPAVRYFWQYRYYLGKLICRHRFSPLIAYCITNTIITSSGDTTDVSMVRLRHTETAQKLLLKSFNGRVATMSFAMRVDPILAVLDESRFLYVFKISSDGMDSIELNCETLLVLQPRDVGSSPSKYQTLTWCSWDSGSGPAVPILFSEPADAHLTIYDDPSMMLAISCGNIVEVINIEAAVRLLSSQAALSPLNIDGDPVDDRNIASGSRCWSRDQLIQLLVKRDDTESGLVYVWMTDHTDAVTATAVSRDASCIASAGLDGQVCIYRLKVGRPDGNGADEGEGTAVDKFCQLTPLLVFSPHYGQPLHGLLFVDECGLENDGKSTWGHLITGAQFNRELRLWSCANWTCSQLMSFHNPPVCIQSADEAESCSPAPAKQPTLTIALDWSASLLVVSDITRRVFYLIEISQVPATPSLTAKTNGCEYPGVKTVRFTSISEFLLSTPCFLFAVGNSDKKVAVSSDPSQPADGNLVTLEIHGIHARHLLNSTIRFHLPSWERTVEPQLADTDDDADVISVGHTSSSSNESPMGSQLISKVWSPGKQADPSQAVNPNHVSSTWSPKSDPQSSDSEKNSRSADKQSHQEGSGVADLVTCLHGSQLAFGTSGQSSSEGPSGDDECPVDYDPTMLAAGIDSSAAPAPDVLTGKVEWIEDSTKPSDQLLPRPFDCPDDAVSRSRVESGQLVVVDSPIGKPNPDGSLDRGSSPARSDVVPSRPIVDQSVGDAAQLMDEPLTQIGLGFAEASQAEGEELEEQEHEGNVEEQEEKQLGFSFMDRLLFSDREGISDAQVERQQPPPEQEIPADVAPPPVESAYLDSLSVWPDGEEAQDQGVDSGSGMRGPANWSTMSLYSMTSSQSLNPATAAAYEDGVAETTVHRGREEEALDQAGEGAESPSILTPAALSPVGEPALPVRPGRGDSCSGQVLALLTQLVAHSKKQDEQMSFLIGELASTQRRLDQLVGTHVELASSMEYLKSRLAENGSDGLVGRPENASSQQQQPWQPKASRKKNKRAGDQLEPTGDIAASSAEPSPDWARQLLLQFRTQQGEYSTRFSALNTTLSTISKCTTEIVNTFRQARPEFGTASIDADRLEKVSQLTVNLMTPVLEQQLRSTLTTNVIQKNMHDAILRSIQDCLSSIPQSVAQTVSRALNDSRFRQQLAVTTSATLSADLAAAYRNSLQQVFLPQLEKTVNKLFLELNGLFQAGTQQYLQQVCSRPQPLPDTGKLAKSITTQLLPPIQKSLKEAIVGAQSAGLAVTSNSDQEQPAKGAKSGAGRWDWTRSSASLACPSAAGCLSTSDLDVRMPPPQSPAATTTTANQQQQQRLTPLPVVPVTGTFSGPAEVDSKSWSKNEALALQASRVQTHLRQGKLDKALELALTTKNQALVMDVCNFINPDQFFNSGQFQLRQNVLLSLIHQLSFGDLSVQSDIKLRYMQDAVLNLDRSQQVTVEYGSKVGIPLVQRLKDFIRTLSSQSTATSVADASTSLLHRARTLLRSAECIMAVNT